MSPSRRRFYTQTSLGIFPDVVLSHWLQTSPRCNLHSLNFSPHDFLPQHINSYCYTVVLFLPFWMCYSIFCLSKPFPFFNIHLKLIFFTKAFLTNSNSRRSLSSLNSYFVESQHHNRDPWYVLSCSPPINEVCLESRYYCYTSFMSHTFFTQHLAQGIDPSVSQQAMTETHSTWSAMILNGVNRLDPIPKKSALIMCILTFIWDRERSPVNKFSLEPGLGVECYTWKFPARFW